MKLDKEQIQFIDETLKLNGVVYQDVKLELIDHIATAIEEYIDENDSDFNEAFKTVFEKWKPELKPAKDSIWFLWDFKGPKIVVDKWISYSRKQMHYILILTLLFGISSTVFFQIYHQNNILEFAHYIVSMFFSIYISITIIGLLLIWFSKIKTTYSRLFIRRSNQVYGLPLFLAFGIKIPFLFNKSWSLPMNLVGNLILAGLSISCIFSIMMLFKHLKTVKKYKLI